MLEGKITKRLVYHLGGYDPVSPQCTHRRFARELQRFETTWSVAATASEAVVEDDLTSWRVMTSGPNWGVETDFRLLRWDDVIAAEARRPMWSRLPCALRAFLDFTVSGTLWGYLRSNWRYAGFFLYPFVILSLFVAFAWGVEALAAKAAGSLLVGIGVGIAAFLLLMRWPARWLFLPLLFDDWIFSREYIRRHNAVLDARLERVARGLVASAKEQQADEILIIGHSLGAVLAVDLLDQALRIDPDLGKSCPPIAFASVGSSLLKIGLHRKAKRFREAVKRVASATQIFWVEYQALTDVMNFYKTNPVAEMGLDVAGRPIVRIERIRRMVHAPRYRRMRRNFFKVHCQFVSGNDQRAAYDYFMLLCGPLSVERQVRYADGAMSAIGSDGGLPEMAADVSPIATLAMEKSF
ncbi:hypothetical protein [Microvirga flavescens]|uniref:hypothetical protein n=1 Tax=Microvirga flavescens TaxID=2249811 RepID=UPI000DD9EFA8|nr:hypothetical protein [Microvirga flavescens]